jgi:hypothetical protein
VLSSTTSITSSSTGADVEDWALEVTELDDLLLEASELELLELRLLELSELELLELKLLELRELELLTPCWLDDELLICDELAREELRKPLIEDELLSEELLATELLTEELDEDDRDEDVIAGCELEGVPIITPPLLLLLTITELELEARTLDARLERELVLGKDARLVDAEELLGAELISALLLMELAATLLVLEELGDDGEPELSDEDPPPQATSRPADPTRVNFTKLFNIQASFWRGL